MALRGLATDPNVSRSFHVAAVIEGLERQSTEVTLKKGEVCFK